MGSNLKLKDIIMELLTIENAIEEYPLFVYSLGVIPDSIDSIIKISIFAFILISLVGVWIWTADRNNPIRILIPLVVLSLGLISVIYIVSLEPRGESEKQEVITAALEKPEYQEKIETTFNDLGTDIDDVCSNEKNYPSLLCFKEQKENVTWLEKKKNRTVTWTDNGISYSMSIVPKYDENNDHITVSLKWEETTI